MKLTLYHISENCLGSQVTLQPGIPECVLYNDILNEESDTPRICCALSPYLCAVGVQVWPQYTEKGVWLYKTEVDVSTQRIYQPTPDDVSDAWKCGELWLLDPTKFELVSEIIVRYQCEITDGNYDRIEVIPAKKYSEGDLLVDRTSPPVYGDDMMHFSFIV